MLNKIRATLCRHWAMLLNLSTLAIVIMVVACLSALLRLNRPFLSEPWDYAAIALAALFILTVMAAKLAIHYFRWQFRREFSCDAPKRSHTAALERLKPLIDHRLICLAAERYTSYQLHQAADADRVKQPSTIQGRARRKQLDKILPWLSDRFDKTITKFDRVCGLAKAFNFKIHDYETYEGQMLQHDEKFQATQLQNSESAGTPTA